MNILDMANQSYGVRKYKKVASTNRGEYAGPCPECGGKDRLRFWPFHDQYEDKGGFFWCRQCGKSGDGIAFARQFLGQNYVDACTMVGVEPATRKNSRMKTKSLSESLQDLRQRQQWVPNEHELPNDTYKENMLKWLDKSLGRPDEVTYGKFQERGIRPGTVDRFGLKYNPHDGQIYSQFLGDLDSPFNTRVRLPRGLVVPVYRGGQLSSVKIRNESYDSHSALPKYLMVKNSAACCGIFDRYPEGKPVVIVESELDAILLAQEVGEFICPMSLGSATKKPDRELHELLLEAPIILVALDCDSPGENAALWWLETYNNARRCYVPSGKDPGEYFLSGGDLKTWVQTSLLMHGHFVPFSDSDVRILNFRLEGHSKQSDSDSCMREQVDLYALPTETLLQLPDGLISPRVPSECIDSEQSEVAVAYKTRIIDTIEWNLRDLPLELQRAALGLMQMLKLKYPQNTPNVSVVFSAREGLPCQF